MISDNTDREEAAKKLIDWHFAVEPSLTEIYRFITEDENEKDEPIKLLEVSEDTAATGRIDWFGFRGAGDIPYSSLTAEITPEEMEKVRQGLIPLPPGWSLEESRRFTRKFSNGAH